MAFFRKTLLGAVAMIALIIPSAHAAEVEIVAPASCKDLDAVRSRAKPGRDLTVHVRETSRGFRGDLAVGRGETRLARTVEAKTCAGVVEALALVVALDAPPESEPEEPAAPEPIAAPASPERAPTAVVIAPPTGPEVALGAGAFLRPLQSHIAGQGFSLFGDVASSHGLFGSPVLLPSIRASLSRTFFDVGHAEGLTIALTTGALDGCPLGARLGAGFSASGCARVELGAMRGSGAGLVPESRFFASAGMVARARWSPGTGLRPFVEIEGGAVMPFTRTTFVAAPPTTINETGVYSLRLVSAPVAQWTTALSAGVVLP
jgi:hypothetical protein